LYDISLRLVNSYRQFSQKVRSAWIISCRIRRQGSCSSTVIASLHCPAKQFNMIEKQRYTMPAVNTSSKHQKSFSLTFGTCAGTLNFFHLPLLCFPKVS
ncbi:unnamed protein product, partial [Musa acuminata subsp. burmannicoides]